MKKNLKWLIMALSLCATSAFAVVTSGCDIKQTINELRCEHVLIDGEVTKEPTCTENGEKIKECTLCTYTETEELDKLGHSEIVLSAVAPTCEKSGLTEGKKCGVCNDVLVAQTVVSPIGHTVTKDEAVAPTCLETGLTEGVHCQVCGKIFIEQETIDALGHTMLETEAYFPTCVEVGYTGGVKCQNCDYVESGEMLPALGHSYDDGEVAQAPTCTEEGIMLYTCTVCSDEKHEAIEKLAHVYIDDVCEACGFNFYEVSGFSMLPVKLDVSGITPALVYEMTFSEELESEIASGVYKELGYFVIESTHYYKTIDEGKTVDYIKNCEENIYGLSKLSYHKEPVSLENRIFRIELTDEDYFNDYWLIPYLSYEDGDTISYKYVSYSSLFDIDSVWLEGSTSAWDNFTRSAVSLAVKALDDSYINDWCGGDKLYSDYELSKMENIVHAACSHLLNIEYSETAFFHLIYNQDFTGSMQEVSVSTGIDTLIPDNFDVYVYDYATGQKRFINPRDLEIPISFVITTSVVSSEDYEYLTINKAEQIEDKGRLRSYVIQTYDQFIELYCGSEINSCAFMVTGFVSRTALKTATGSGNFDCDINVWFVKE